MTAGFTKHFLLDTDTVKDYAKHLNFFADDEEITAKEIGDGNINYVFQISSNTRSIVIKQADKLLRSSGRPLDVYRSKIEAEILSIQKSLAPEFIPTVYNYNDIMCALAMEDISEFKNMRHELMAAKVFPKFADQITTFFAKTLLPTTDLLMDSAEKKDMVRLFTNKALCDISEDLVFTEPYYDYKHRNIITAGQEAFVTEFLYENHLLHAEVGKLRERFMNYPQALIHGDLHTGSLFINDSGLKIIDPEFAFYAPMGYDIGNVIGNLFFAWGYNYYAIPQNCNFLDWIASAIADIFDLTKAKLDKAYDTSVTLPIYRTPNFKSYYLRQITSDSIGYAGTEIIRRVIGDAKVSELTSTADPVTKCKFERALIKFAIFITTQRERFTCGSEITDAFSDIIGKD